MADPRDILRYEGIHRDTITAKIDNSTITYSATAVGGSASVGLAVMLSANSTIALTNDAAAVYGKLLHVESDGKATVQVGGYVTLPGGNAATLTAGTAIVGALGAASARGYIRTSVAATLSDVAKQRGRIVDSATATAVVVQL